MRIRPLPPLNSLVVFEAVARHLSVTKAADELRVTQGAISRQVRHLEAYLETALFTRKKKRLQLTATGLSYYKTVRPLLLTLSDATAEITQARDDEPITVVTTNAMASFWLLPKYQAFQELYPDINLRILAVDSQQDIHQSEFDLALFYRRELPRTLRSTPLFEEQLFPVCSPTFLARHPELQELSDLSRVKLLSLDVNDEWFGWPDWFAEFGIPYDGKTLQQLNMNNYLLVVQAALNGQGVALAWKHLVDDYLNSGLLVAPFSARFKTPSQFYLLEPERRPKPGVDRFRQWLLQTVNSAAPSP
ncbi:LysR substrate-binding domain-containing protein [Aquisalimonas sp.]|uniref:LysR substrate-binding domain-containing protein n=1 Tax=Aquisalimonas sp. TaxID=1872621 RepID=UPI0025C0B418|nr:LysR substrate-binding domain-containing protein [Aquisalimonas sp.]